MADSTRYTLPPHETLAILNSHLGRFLAHTDELLQECQTFGDSVRSSLEVQVGKLDSTVAAAMAEAGQHAADQLGGHIDRAIGNRLSVLRQELEALVDLAGKPAGPARQRSRETGQAGKLMRGTTHTDSARSWTGLGLVGLLLVAANLMLAALLVVGIIRQGDAAPTPDAPATSAASPAGPGIASAIPGAAPEVTLGSLCEGLASEPNPDQARAFVAAAAAAWCTSDAGAVTTNVLRALPPETTDGESAAPKDKPRGARSTRRRKKS